MPRRKPVSGKQHKAELQLKRAQKRGDAPSAESNVPAAPRKKRTQKGSTVRSSSAAVLSARRLQSAFLKLSEQFLEEGKRLASELVLPRPIPFDAASWREIDRGYETKFGVFTCPRRPKWAYDMAKKEVEKNEEGLFKKWLEETDRIAADWQRRPASVTSESLAGELQAEEPGQMPQSPTYYERNLEVWRQLWRVTEISQILLVLLDSRCPPLHFPPSLSTYLSSRKVILVLTKVDITGPARTAAWTAYLRSHHPGIRVVPVESYVVKEGDEMTQGRRVLEPHLPTDFRERLVQALRETHEEFLAPPDAVKAKGRIATHRIAPVKKEVNWEQVLNAHGDMVGTIVGGAAVPKGQEGGDVEVENGVEPEFLTIGLIGQPNVGKSSLLNALFGAHKVRASRTPGKTKHFQTLFWTPEVRLVDCPGLVMPNFVPLEMQVLSGILPIAMVSSIPSCIHHAALLLPLERIFNLTHPLAQAQTCIDKRTWRGDGPVAPKPSSETPTRWTAMDILTAYAEQNGWVTAKAGRPDVMRAGNAILRALAEGRVPWGFWPDGGGPPLEEQPGCGIWIPSAGHLQDEDYDSEELEKSDQAEGTALMGDEMADSEVADDDDDGDDHAESDVEAKGIGLGRFGALALDAGDM